MASGDKIRVATYSEVDSIDTRVTTLEDDNDGNAVSMQDIPVISTAPLDGDALVYNGTTGQYEPSRVGADVSEVVATYVCVTDTSNAAAGEEVFYQEYSVTGGDNTFVSTSAGVITFTESGTFSIDWQMQANNGYNIEFELYLGGNLLQSVTVDHAESSSIFKFEDQEVTAGDTLTVIGLDTGWRVVGGSDRGYIAVRSKNEALASATKATIITQSSIEPIEVSGLYYIDTVSQAISLVLPTTGVVEGDIIDFQDRSDSWETNNVTLTTEDASTIEGDSNYTLDVSSMTVQTMYNGTNWEIHATGYSAVVDSGSGQVYSYSPVPICAIQFHATNGITTFGLSGFSSEEVASSTADYHRIYTGTTSDAYDVFQEYDVVYATVSGGESDNIINLVNSSPTGSHATYGYAYYLSSVDNSFWTTTAAMGADFDNVANLFITFYGVNYG